MPPATLVEAPALLLCGQVHADGSNRFQPLPEINGRLCYRAAWSPRHGAEQYREYRQQVVKLPVFALVNLLAVDVEDVNLRGCAHAGTLSFLSGLILAFAGSTSA